jgi:hypothetical protein
MTTRWPAAVSSIIHSYKPAGIHRTSTQLGQLTVPLRPHHIINIRQHAVRQYATDKSDSSARHEKLALIEAQGLRPSDPINPSPSTLPPPLSLPTRKDHSNIVLYYFHVGRTYGSFYWTGIKAVWFNYQAAKLIRQRLPPTTTTTTSSPTHHLQSLTRAEFQLLARNRRDIGKLPFFGLLVALFGEWLPLLVPFFPGAVPGTCRIPQQVRGMREAAEARRRAVFRQRIAAPTTGAEMQAASTPWALARREGATRVLAGLRPDQLWLLSSVCGLHGCVWDRVRVAPPAPWLRMVLATRLVYLASDDYLLVRQGGGAVVGKMGELEVVLACEERGMNVLGKSPESLRKELQAWLERQEEDEGTGGALLRMLFRREGSSRT